MAGEGKKRRLSDETLLDSKLQSSKAARTDVDGNAHDSLENNGTVAEEIPCSSSNQLISENDQSDDKKTSLTETEGVGAIEGLTSTADAVATIPKEEEGQAQVVVQQQQQPPCQRRKRPGHQKVEDYISTVGNIMYPGTYLGPYGMNFEQGRYPVERVTTLAWLMASPRPRSVLENWNPREIATFEAALSMYGKVFHKVQKCIGTKSTKEIVEFYYVWKKTSHYQQWKEQYEPDVESDDDDSSTASSEGSDTPQPINNNTITTTTTTNQPGNATS
eukprot:scaffold10192_cov36-Attheya_sp.AAC.2